MARTKQFTEIRVSSIRVDSLRLCWLEAFVAVANEENISAAARSLDVSQPTVSRYVEALKRWTGKDLIRINRMSDPQDPGVNVEMTEAGRELFDIAEAVISQLSEFRTDRVKSEELLAGMRKRVGVMLADLGGDEPTRAAQKVAEHIRIQHRLAQTLTSATPFDALQEIDAVSRTFFAQYETERGIELRSRERRKRGGIDPKTLTVPSQGKP